MTFVYVPFCVVSGGGLDILLTTHSERHALGYLSSVLFLSLFPPYRQLTVGHLVLILIYFYFLTTTMYHSYGQR